MKTIRQFLALPFVLLALVGVIVGLIGTAVMTAFGGVADWVGGE